MSWKRVLRAARRMGTPVIVADDNAKDPLVILPLDIYESLTAEGERAHYAPGLPSSASREALGASASDDRLASVFESPEETLPMEDLTLPSQKNKIETATDAAEPGSEEEAAETEIPLEDRYYFEPLEDEPKK